MTRFLACLHGKRVRMQKIQCFGKRVTSLQLSLECFGGRWFWVFSNERNLEFVGIV